MARDLKRAPSTVHGWKSEGRVPATEQPHVLERGQALGLPITTEHVVFPLGRPADADPDLATTALRVACDRAAEAQLPEAAR